MQILFSLQEQSVFSDKKSGENSLLQSRDPDLLTFSAKQKHLFEGEMASALSLLQRALTSNAYYVPAWLSLAELNNDLGKKQQANAILTYVDILTKDVKRWRWEKTLVDYQLGRVAVLPGDLRYIIHEIPGKNRHDALQLAYTLWDNPEQLYENLGQENLLPLFDYAVRRSMPEKGLFFWHIIESGNVPWQEKQVLSFLEMLMRTEKVVEAGKIWRKYFNSTDLMYNGNFSQPLMQVAFGWRSGKDQGFEKRFKETGKNESGRDLHYRFKGWENLKFQHLFQVVPLMSGRQYKLTAEFKSQKMTTDERPFFEIYGYKCKMPYAKTEMVAPDQEWKSLETEFEVPETCAAVVIRLRRNESRQIDNKLSGQMWLKNVIISEIARNSELLDDYP